MSTKEKPDQDNPGGSGTSDDNKSNKQAINAQDSAQDGNASEYCFSAHVNFAYKPKHRGRLFDQQVTAVIHQIIGHANSVGGVGIITSKQKYEAKDLDNWARIFSERLANVIPRHVLQSCISMIPKQSELLILITKSPEFITAKFRMHTRGVNASNYEVKDLQTCLDIINQPKCQANDMINLDGLRVGDEFPEQETKNVEFKHWDSSENIRAKVSADRTRKCIIGFPNIKGGGHMFGGVEEDSATGKNIIRGQTLTEEQKTEIKLGIEECFENVKTISGVIKWNLEFVSLIKSNQEDEERFLVHITVEQTEGGVFENTPESYVVQHDGTLKPLSFDEWVQMILKSPTTILEMECENSAISESENSSSSETDSDIDNESDTQDTDVEPQIENAERHDLHIYLPKDPEPVHVEQEPVIDDTVMDRKLKATKTLSYSDFSSYWKEDKRNLKTKNYDVQDNAINLMHLSEDGHYLPPRDILLNMCPNRVCLDSAITQITAITGGSAYMVLSTQSWTTRLCSGEPCVSTTGHICDVFVLNDDGEAAITSVIDEQSTTTPEQDTYIRRTCKLLKREIILSLENCESRKVASKINFHIRPFTLSLQDGIMKSVTMSTNKEAHRAIGLHFSPHRNHDQLDLMKKAIFLVLVKYTSSVKNRLGALWQCELTKEQMEQLLQTSLSRFNFIVGPPGSGKSIMAHHLCGYFNGHHEKERVLFVCTRSSFKAYVETQDNATTYLLMTPQDLDELVEQIRQTNNLQCIIIDDVHTLSLADESWMTLFLVIKEKGVYFYIFVDPYFQNYIGEQNTTKLAKLFHEFCSDSHVSYTSKALTEILRNSQKVGSFIKANATNATEDPVPHDSIRPQSSVEGDDVTIKYLDNLKSTGSDNGILHYVASALTEQPSSDYAYVQSDLAILVDDDDEVRAQELADFYYKLFQNHAPEIRVQTASEYPVRGMVIDIVDNFSGLDVRFCICIVPDMTSENTVRSLNNTKYKNFIASRGVDRVDYILPTHITCSVARTMMLDDLSSLRAALDEQSDEDNEVDVAGGEDDAIAEEPIVQKEHLDYVKWSHIPAEVQMQASDLMLTDGDLEFGSLLAAGSTVDVLRGRYSPLYGSKQTVAITCLKYTENDTEYAVRYVKKMIEIKKLDHPSLMTVLGLTIVQDIIYAVQPWMANGTLREYCHKTRSSMRPARMWILLYDVALGMEYLHNNDIIIDTLKADICLVDREKRVRISSRPSVMKTTATAWLAPEQLQDRSLLTEKSDVWSYGVLMWEVFSRGGVPFDGCSEDHVRESILSGNLTEGLPTVHDMDCQLHRDCLSRSPDDRPSFSDIVQHIMMEIMEDTYS